MKAFKTKRGVCYHPESTCAPDYCPFHNPSQHKMRDWPINIRWDRDNLVERICPHGTGHPDPDDLIYRARIFRFSKDDIWADGVHGCDGCCVEERNG